MYNIRELCSRLRTLLLGPKPGLVPGFLLCMPVPSPLHECVFWVGYEHAVDPEEKTWKTAGNSSAQCRNFIYVAMSSPCSGLSPWHPCTLGHSRPGGI